MLDKNLIFNAKRGKKRSLFTQEVLLSSTPNQKKEFKTSIDILQAYTGLAHMQQLNAYTVVGYESSKCWAKTRLPRICSERVTMYSLYMFQVSVEPKKKNTFGSYTTDE